MRLKNLGEEILSNVKIIGQDKLIKKINKVGFEKLDPIVKKEALRSNRRLKENFLSLGVLSH